MFSEWFTLSEDWEKIYMQLLVFCMSFVSVFFGVQFTKYIAKVWEDSPKKSMKHSTILPLDDFVAMPLIRKEILSHDTARFTFALPKADHVLGLPTGQHVSLKYYMDDKTAVQRSYTPVTDNSSVGEFSLVIKVYKPLPPKFPEGGKMSQHLDAMKIGETILVHGPKGHTEYKGLGKLSVKPLGKPLQERYTRHIGMMAGGTGVTPMLQVLHHIFHDTKDTTTQIRMIYANQTEDDILVREELETLQVNFPTRFTLWYTVDRVVPESNADQWPYDIGFINEAMVEKHLMFPKNVQNPQFLMCGPPPMIKFACLPALQALGYSEKDWVIF
jgi:cytochrome-b5 reductase